MEIMWRTHLIKLIFMQNDLLNPNEAYKAMIYFLEDVLSRFKSDDLAVLLGSMDINKFDNKPMDPALWNDWLKAVKKLKQTS